MNNSQVAHRWASQINGASPKDSRGSNFYFEGPRLFSYGSHYVAGLITDRTDANGERVVLTNANGYSSSTRRHLSYMRNALHGLNVRTFDVYEVFDGEWSHRENVKAWAREFVSLIEQAGKARTRGPFLLADAERLQHDAADYCAIFGVELPAELAEAINPELIARVSEQRKAREVEERERAERRERMRAASYAEKIAEWRAGASVHECGLWAYSDMPTELRMTRDGLNVETSRGALVSVGTARRLFGVLRMVHDDAMPEHARENIVRGASDVDGFQLREIFADGGARIGCHVLQWAQIESFARHHGWMA